MSRFPSFRSTTSTRKPLRLNALSSAQRHRRRPRLESLEERTLLSSYATFFELDGNTTTTGVSGSHDWDQVYSDLTKATNASGSVRSASITMRSLSRSPG